MSQLSSDLAAIIFQKFVELFKISLKKPLTLSTCAPALAPLVPPLFHASIGVTGKGIAGVFTVVTDQRFLHQSHPERRYGGALEESDYLDWIAEIANRTLAGSKPAIQTLGFQLRLEQPLAKKSLPEAFPNLAEELTMVLESEEYYATLKLCLSRLEVSA